MGAAVTEFAPGDCVFGYARLDTVEHGTVAEKVVLPVRVLAKAPTSIELERAAGVPLTGLTAFQLTRRLDIQPGEIVLIRAPPAELGSSPLSWPNSLAQLLLARHPRGIMIICAASEWNRLGTDRNSKHPFASLPRMA